MLKLMPLKLIVSHDGYLKLIYGNNSLYEYHLKLIFSSLSLINFSLCALEDLISS
jgi:hypothetical protein